MDDNKPTCSSLLSSQDEEEDDYSDDEDETGISPYEGPTPISGLIDRLEGYGGLAETSEVCKTYDDISVSANDVAQNTTADAISTANTVKISLWDEDTDADENHSGSENSAATVTSRRLWTMQGSGTLIDVPMIPNSRQHSSRSRSYTPAANSSATLSAVSTPAGVAPHLNRLASRPNINYQTQTTQVGRFTDSGEGTQSIPNRILPGRVPLGQKSEEGIKRSALHLVDGVPLASSANGWKPDIKTQSGKGSKNQWYKGVSIYRAFLLPMYNKLTQVRTTAKCLLAARNICRTQLKIERKNLMIPIAPMRCKTRNRLSSALRVSFFVQ